MSKKLSNPNAPIECKTLPSIVQTSRITIDPTADPLLINYVNQDEERQRIWSAANEEFRGVIVQVGEWFLNVHRVDILQRYQLAELITKLNDDHMKNRERRYGSYAVRKLTKFFRWESTTLYAALRLATVYSRAEIEQISLLRLQDGRPLSYFHVELLSGIDDRKTREEFLKRTLTESWNTRELAYHILQLEKSAKKETDGRGRPLAIPRNLDAMIQQQDRTAEDFLSRSLKVWQEPKHYLLTMVQDFSQEQCTEERAAQLLTHAQKLRRLAEEAHKRAEEAEIAYAFVLRELEYRTRSAKAPVPRSAEQDCFSKKQSAALAAAINLDFATE